MDKPYFDYEKFLEDYPITSPKLDALIRNIQALDEIDKKKHGIYFKHVIYTDIKSSASGAKMIAAGLMSNGYTNIYNNKLEININKIYHNFALLSSVDIYNKPFNIKIVKKILEIYNDRINNINGKNVRIIILDQGFKEGIDLFDVKYVHLFEQLLTKSEENQVVGRSTRFCGQKGLNFDPNLGWPLYVYRYEVEMNNRQKNKYGVNNLTELYIKNSGINLNKYIFANELEIICRYGAVDYELNKKIHDFGNEKTDKKDFLDEETLKTLMGLPYKITINGLKLLESKEDIIYQDYKKLKINNFELAKKVPNPLMGGYKYNIEKSPSKKINFIQMRNYINKIYNKYTWNDIKFENLCIKNEELSNNKKEDRIIKFTPTQEFISRYFNKSTFAKGMLLWHSVGTGKTCSAIAIASRGFEPYGYTILWVTRHTLKPDIWKNIFNSVCSLSLQEKIKRGEYVPEGYIKSPLKYLSKNWLMPISYKQFSNMLLEKNKLYNEMKRRNGAEDPLRKTLVIIDEVHKLYSNELSIVERPNINILKEKIKRSYKISKENSVRLLLMSATPYTNNPMNLIKILNLLRNEVDIPENFETFKKIYLDDNSTFTKKGAKIFLDEITGYISYLNRQRDTRQFSYPVFYNINVKMSEIGNKNIINNLEKYNKHIINIIKKIKIINNPDDMVKIKELEDTYNENIKRIKSEKYKMIKNISQEENIDNCLKI
jgi:superfamily II DNA or RNA helicase